MTLSLDLFRQAANLNKVGVSFLASGHGSEAMKAFKQALVVMTQLAQHHDSEDLFHSNAQISAAQPIQGLENSFYLYSNCFVFEASTGMDVAFSNAIIMFNFALVFHQRGMKYGREKILRKAMSLYELSTELITEMSPSAGSLLLAALNNTAQIQFELGQYQEARETLDMLQGETLHLSSLDFSPDILGQDQIGEFFLNVTLTRPPMTAASA